MNYNEAIEFVHAIPKFVRPLGNEKLGGLLGLLGNPQNSLKFIHIAGTNGKGSVSTMLAEVLGRAGYKTGLFTSPFIEVFNERIRINGDMIDDEVLAGYITDTREIMQKNDAQVSEFAFITAVAMKYFADEKCDIVVLETGMGGRLDATNIISVPECAVITSISLDHTQYLGETIEEIALEKCGIIKEGGRVVSAPNVEAVSIISNEAEKRNATLFVCEKAVKTNGGFIYKNKEYELGLMGEYQAENAAVVLETLSVLRKIGYVITDMAIKDGFKYAKWQARYEFVTPDMVIDGGHNPGGIKALKESLKKENRKITLVLAMMADKDYKECIADIISVAESVVATEVDMPRSLKAWEIKAVCDENGADCIEKADIASAIETAKAMANGGLVCVCGSLYLAGEVKRLLK